MSNSNFSKIKLVNNCVNNVCLFLSKEKPTKRYLVISLCSINKSKVAGTISNVRLKNPLNSKCYIYPISLSSLINYPDVFNDIKKIYPKYSYSTADKFQLQPMSFIFDITECICHNKKLCLLYTTNCRKPEKKIKIKLDISKAISNRFF